ncbi:membrane protein [Streptomyces camponoticapitis]|uniref:Membrane protein n=1 Tax=Streptomyces camponoticapitis TaxID=1616125 RepID=A0ABQ2ECQ5_9ACTN|nr:DUF485 domain-containing protein [Streptomyces camponoticapitis]GGK05744.1 membrane protein [Streptomyces camponoticapitis]
MEKQEGRDAAAVRTDDPWYDALASGWGELDGTGTPTTPVAPAPVAATEHEPRAAEIYLEVQRSAAFQEVRSRYRRFVVPATLAFLAWYLAYVVAATTAPELMARPVAGAVNVAMVAGLGQFLSTFLLTWAYSRHARLHRDRDALDLRWSVFDRTRAQEQHRTREHDRTREQHGPPERRETQHRHTARAGERR